MEKSIFIQDSFRETDHIHTTFARVYCYNGFTIYLFIFIIFFYNNIYFIITHTVSGQGEMNLCCSLYKRTNQVNKFLLEYFFKGYYNSEEKIKSISTSLLTFI